MNGTFFCLFPRLGETIIYSTHISLALCVVQNGKNNLQDARVVLQEDIITVWDKVFKELTFCVVWKIKEI